MNVLNHSATGAALAIATGQPAIALPLAFASHFVLDALPHHGHPGNGGYPEALKHKKLTFFSLGYEAIGLPILIWLLIGQSWFVWLAAVLAVSPDLKWPYRYWFFERKGLEPPKLDKLSRFHQWIQWCERPWGIVVEILYSMGILWLIWRLV